jgi:mRNA-degrading endonuclease RelE of RelBE toxin-antitoxin system
MDRVIVWSDDSLRQLKKFKKKRPKLSEDVVNFEKEFAEGRLPGDKITNLGNTLAKEHRMMDSSSDTGKRGGFRVYYRYNDSRVEIHGVYLRKNINQRVRNEIQRILKQEGPL